MCVVGPALLQTANRKLGGNCFQHRESRQAWRDHRCARGVGVASVSCWVLPARPHRVFLVVFSVVVVVVVVVWLWWWFWWCSVCYCCVVVALALGWPKFLRSNLCGRNLSGQCATARVCLFEPFLGTGLCVCECHVGTMCSV